MVVSTFIAVKAIEDVKEEIEEDKYQTETISECSK